MLLSWVRMQREEARGGNGIWKWNLEMEFGNGIWKWNLEMEFGNGIWKWNLEMEFGVDSSDHSYVMMQLSST